MSYLSFAETTSIGIHNRVKIVGLILISVLYWCFLLDNIVPTNLSDIDGKNSGNILWSF